MSEENDRDAMANGTFRAPGFVIVDEQGYDLDLAKASVGPGWSDIIERLWAKKPADVKVEQVKEKFGGLRFYTGSAPKEFLKEIQAAEAESYKTCESCGQPGVVRKGGWLKTLCDVHADGRPPYGPWR